MRKKTPPTLGMIRSINLDMGLPTTGIDALIEAVEAVNDDLFALYLAALSELENQAESVTITKH